MNIYDATFLLFPVIAIVAKELLKLRISLWLVFLVWIGFGWLLINLSVWQQYEMLDEIMRHTLNPSEELIERWQNDGASHVFTLYFGWIPAAIYYFLCLPTLYILRFVKKRIVSYVVT